MWCYFVCTLSLYTLIGIWTHFTWVVILLVNCVYFSAWKSYDIFWFWLDTGVSACVPRLRPNNYTTMCCWLLAEKCRRPGKSLKQIYKEKPWKPAAVETAGATATDNTQPQSAPHADSKFYVDYSANEAESSSQIELGEKAPPEQAANEGDGGSESSDMNLAWWRNAVGCCARCRRERQRAVAEPSENAFRKRWADAFSMTMFIYRVRVSAALIFGNLRRQVLSEIGSVDYEGPLLVPIGGAIMPWKRYLWKVSWLSIYVDCALLYVYLLWAYCRHCRLCCTLGLCRFVRWLLLVILVDVIVMEIPMHIANQYYDGTWCQFVSQSGGDSWTNRTGH